MKIGKYIVIILIVLSLAFCIGQFKRGGEIAIVEGFNTWWTDLYERYEARKSSDSDADPGETDENADESPKPTDEEEKSSGEEVPEKQPPVTEDELFIENKDGSVSMCPYDFVSWAQKNAQYNEESACGPFNIPHEDEKVFPVRFDCDHDHSGEKVKLMLSQDELSVFCCDQQKNGHDIGVWNVPSGLCVGFNPKIDTCKVCEGITGINKVIGAISVVELNSQQWKVIEKVACYWWETNEFGEKVRVFGLNPCGCESDEDEVETVPSAPSGPSGPSGGGEEPTPDPDPTPTDPPIVSVDPPEVIPVPTPEPEHNGETEPQISDHSPETGPEEGDEGEGSTTPEEQPAVDPAPIVVVGEPTEVPVPESQPPVDPTPIVGVGEPTEVPVPESQPADISSEHSGQNAPVIVEAIPAPAAEESAPAVEVSAPAVEVSAPAVEVSAPAVEVSAPAVEVSAPAVEVSAPAVEVSAPAVEVSAPAVEVSAPAAPVAEAPTVVEAKSISELLA